MGFNAVEAGHRPERVLGSGRDLFFFCMMLRTKTISVVGINNCFAYVPIHMLVTGIRIGIKAVAAAGKRVFLFLQKGLRHLFRVAKVTYEGIVLLVNEHIVAGQIAVSNATLVHHSQRLQHLVQHATQCFNIVTACPHSPQREAPGVHPCEERFLVSMHDCNGEGRRVPRSRGRGERAKRAHKMRRLVKMNLKAKFRAEFFSAVPVDPNGNADNAVEVAEHRFSVIAQGLMGSPVLGAHKVDGGFSAANVADFILARCGIFFDLEIVDDGEFGACWL